MCTAITMQTKQGENYIGRTMDFSHPLAPQVYVIPRGYGWRNALNTNRISNRYSCIGTGQELPQVILADGVNEAGFAAAALYFPGFAFFPDPAGVTDTRKAPIAAIELVNFLLGSCASVEHAMGVLRTIQIVGTEDPVTNSVAPLHWMISDKSGKCMVVEQTRSGLHLMNNPIGVFGNSPDFPWHLTNLRNYLNVMPGQLPEARWGTVALTPFGQGGGTVGLPGGYTPPARFVRTAYLKSHTPVPVSREEAVVTCFHIMESVTIPKGVVVTDRGADDFTQYTVFMNMNTGEYFFKTYANSEIVAVKPYFEATAGSRPVSLGKLIRPTVFGEI